MLTTGEAITAVQRFYLNPGADVYRLDVEERERARFMLTGICQRIWTAAPHWFKRGRGSVALTSGVGSMPNDFGAFGTQGKVYIAGRQMPALAYRPPETILELLNSNASAGLPQLYTLLGVGGTGLVQILTWPVDNSTLALEGYDRVMPELIDIPISPVYAVNAVAGNLNGTYTYRVTFVSASGETEAGILLSENAIAPANQRASLTEIPTSFARAVTARKVYRNAAATPNVHQLLTTIADNTTTVFSDNVIDASLGADAPTPASALFTGLEVFPRDFHESLIMEALTNAAKKEVGEDYDENWKKEIRRMWGAQDPAEHQAKLMPAYGEGAGLPSSLDYWRSRIPLV